MKTNKTGNTEDTKKPARPASGFDTVKIFREIKDKISQELKGKSIEEIKAFLKKESLKFQKGLE